MRRQLFLSAIASIALSAAAAGTTGPKITQGPNGVRPLDCSINGEWCDPNNNQCCGQCLSTDACLIYQGNYMCGGCSYI